MNILKNHGIKVTKHRVAVLKLFEKHKHLDAGQIYKELNSKEETISLATIYRILANLEQHEVVIKNNFNSEQASYELNLPNTHHDHLICTKCNKVIEFFNCRLEQIQEKIASENHFMILTHQLNLYGICEKCQKKLK